MKKAELITSFLALKNRIVVEIRLGVQNWKIDELISIMVLFLLLFSFEVLFRKQIHHLDLRNENFWAKLLGSLVA